MLFILFQFHKGTIKPAINETRHTFIKESPILAPIQFAIFASKMLKNDIVV